MSAGWAFLVVAGLFEVVWAYFLTESQGFTRLWPSVMFVISLIVSMGLLALSLRTLPLSIAYPLWTGIGAVGSILVGTIFFSEPMDWLRGLFLFFIIVGILGLKVVSN